ncbi:alpha/beta hydrolase [Thalassomonas actiniarum]|uniref:Alpha/beta hydrolase n=1 Tax=Thalassomonas actiniarum TaxID=485447 RepID=A0AAE9YJQ3_9GAMM|nr:alpha/beta hydrolase [Thalassomonas actiniarum]WDD97159.1 alpha/beta hydrolase [Thalassomonas actiniarum]
MKYKQLEPGIRELVQAFNDAGCPSGAGLDIKSRRRGYLETVSLAGTAEQVFLVQDKVIDGIPLRIFKPCADNNLAVVIYFHGGCFVSGDFATHDQQMRKLANLSGAMVIGVDYRLAPEFTYPAAHDDAYRASQLIYQHCREWGGDPQKIILAGDSAGGHLCLNTSLRLRDEGNWLPKKQVLIYPMLDARGESESYVAYGENYLITREMLLSGFDLYLAGSNIAKQDPQISPLYHRDLTGLPQTHVLTAEFDPLLNEGEQLYRNLLEAGVDARCRRYLGVIHGFFQLSGVSPSAREAVEHVAGLCN